MRRALRLTGSLLIAVGVLTLAWAIVVWRWQDPFTALYTHVQQTRLERTYKKQAAEFHTAHGPKIAHGNLAALRRSIAAEARGYARTLQPGDPIGRIRIGRIGLKMVLVQGTDHESLKKGPGHYTSSGLPGEGALIYVAGHRTTYLAPFAYINEIRAGDYITIEVPYGTFTYRATRHYVVPSTDLAVLRNHGREVLRLQACHPRFFATHRYIVDARLVSVAPRGGTPFSATQTSLKAFTPARGS
jgi:sortase A